MDGANGSLNGRRVRKVNNPIAKFYQWQLSSGALDGWTSYHLAAGLFIAKVAQWLGASDLWAVLWVLIIGIAWEVFEWFVEGDAENMPFLDEEFDIVVSQYGHMFAPQPDVVIDEMGRVLKTGGVLAFSTWPSEMFMGQFFKLVGEFSPPLPNGASSPVLWGDTKIISERLEKKFKNIEFARDAMMAPTLSPGHMLNLFEKNAGPLAKLVEALADNTSKLQDLRTRTLDLISKFFLDNYLRQDFLMTKCIKK